MESRSIDDFPYKATSFTPADIDSDTSWKEHVSVKVLENENVRVNTLGTHGVWNFYGQNNVFITSDIPMYEVIEKLTDYFTEAARVRANVKNHPSPYDYWQANKREIRRKYPGDIKQQREEIYRTTKEATLFKISASYALFKYLDSRVVLDPSAGWGDRLLGAAYADVEVYHGIDPNTQLRSGYESMIDYYQLDPNKYTLTTDDFLKVKIRGKYDTVFTSPPFFDFESYSKETTQSISGRRSFDDWVENFYRPYLNKASEALIKGGRFCLYVSDTRLVPRLVDTTILIMSEIPHMTLWGNIGIKYPDTRNVFPIWIWNKTN